MNREIRLYDELRINDFKPFNQSLKFLDQVVDNVGGKYEVADDDYNILLYGRSGTRYKIELNFNQKLARKLHSGYTRLTSKEIENYLPILLSVFEKVFDYICIGSIKEQKDGIIFAFIKMNQRNPIAGNPISLPHLRYH